MSKKAHFSARQEIQNWSIENVLQVLEKNNLAECCDAFKNRGINGESLLALTEGKLALWKKDISLSSIRKLSKFIQDLSLQPEKYSLQDMKNMNGNTHISQSSRISPVISAPKRPIYEDTGLKNTSEQPSGVSRQHTAMQHTDSNSNTSFPKGQGLISALLSESNLKRFAPPESSSSGSEEGWGSDFSSNDTEGEEEGENKILPSSQTPVVNGVLHQSSNNVGKSGEVNGHEVNNSTVKQPQQRLPKPPLPSRPPMLKAKPLQSSLHKLPAPPQPEIKHLVKDISLSPALQKVLTEAMDDEEQYESIDNDQLPSREFIAALINRSFPSSTSPLSLKDDENTDSHENNIPTQTSLDKNNVKSVTEESDGSLAPLQHKSKYNNGPVLPPRQLPPNPPIHLQKFMKSPPPVSADTQEADEKYESIEGQSENRQKLRKHTNSSDNNDYVSDEYESIKDNSHIHLSQFATNAAQDYYLPPLQQPHKDEAAPPPLPSKLRVSIELPSNRPPSPPRRKSDDSSSSSPGNSGDGVTGRLGELFRKVINRPNTLQTNTPDNREKTPTPDKKVPNLPPAPPQKPPAPPIERRQNQRPLPPTPGASPNTEHNNVTLRKASKANIQHAPWFHNINRKGAEELLQNSEDGMFLLRPTTHSQNIFTLTLWYNKRLYNIGVRQRPDGKFALGTEKQKEQTFSTVEELVTNYQSEKLVLYSGGERTGQTLLTKSPPKKE